MHTSTTVIVILSAAFSMSSGIKVWSQVAGTTPTFEVVSVRRVVPDAGGKSPAGSRIVQRPDGGLTAENVSVAMLIARAYPSVPTVEVPDWVRRERYDVRTTASLPSATPADRMAMLRAMLADRFKLAVRVDKRDQPAFDLIVARRDGTLGLGLTEVKVQCQATPAAADTSERPVQPQLPDFKTPPQPCTLRIVGAPMRDSRGDAQGRLGDLLEGEATMAALADALSIPAGRPVVDKTGLPGTYRVVMNFDNRFARVGPTIAPSTDPNSAPSVFSAVEAQLGLKLESSQTLREVLVIEHVDRPTEN